MNNYVWIKLITFEKFKIWNKKKSAESFENRYLWKIKITSEKRTSWGGDVIWNVQYLKTSKCSTE